MGLMHPAALLNTVNLTSAVGFLLADLSGCEVRARGGAWQATGYRWAFPPAGAVTVGSVVISRRRLPEGVWQHELSHVRQYAVLGPVFWPAYAVAASWSWVRTGDWWSRNIFERLAGLTAGGYTPRPLRGTPAGAGLLRLRRSGRTRPAGTVVASATA
jgi:hypothetical protein